VIIDSATEEVMIFEHVLTITISFNEMPVFRTLKQKTVTKMYLTELKS